MPKPIAHSKHFVFRGACPRTWHPWNLFVDEESMSPCGFTHLGFSSSGCGLSLSVVGSSVSSSVQWNREPT